MVDMNELEAGDVAVRRDGEKFVVKNVSHRKGEAWEFVTNSERYGVDGYTKDGCYFHESVSDKDIVLIIKKDIRMVDLSKAKVGDIAIFRENSAGIIESITDTKKGYYQFEVFAPCVEGTYRKDGAWLRGKENNRDIIQVIPNPHGKTIAEIVEDGVKTARPKPMKFLFKGEKEPRELKVGDRLIYDSGSLYDVILTKVEGLKLRSLVSGTFRSLPTSIDQSKSFLIVHDSDKVIERGVGCFGIFKCRTDNQIVVDTVEGLEIWSADICRFI